jgi:hypothetical protein
VRGAGSAGTGVSSARAAWITRLPGVELADLVWDSDLDVGDPPWSLSDGVDGGSSVDGPSSVVARCARPRPGVRLMCFAGPWIKVTLELDRGPSRAVRGQVAPATSGSVRVQTGPFRSGGPSGLPTEVRLDADGRFGLSVLRRGPLRIVLVGAGGPVVATSWVMID